MILINLVNTSRGSTGKKIANLCLTVKQNPIFLGKAFFFMYLLVSLGPFSANIVSDVLEEESRESCRIFPRPLLRRPRIKFKSFLMIIVLPDF
jgi:hypothetical protein